MKAVQAIVLTLAALWLSVPMAGAGEWEAYEMKDDNCKAAFPGTPRFDGAGYLFARGSVKSSVTASPIRSGDTRSRAARSDVIRDAFVRDMQGKLFLDTSVKWKGHYGRHFAFSFRAEGHLWTQDTKVIEVESKAYVLTLITLLGDDTEEGRRLRERQVTRFFDSFDLLTAVKSTAQPESQSFAGVWVVRLQKGDASFPGNLTGTEFELHDGKFTLRSKKENSDIIDGLFRGAYRLKEKDGKGEIDLRYDILAKAKPGVDQTIAGVWAIKGDALEWSLGEPGGARPMLGGGAVRLLLTRPGER